MELLDPFFLSSLIVLFGPVSISKGLNSFLHGFVSSNDHQSVF